MSDAKDDGLAGKPAPMARCPQCQSPLQHRKESGQIVARCPNCDAGRDMRGSIIKGLKPEPVATR